MMINNGNFTFVNKCITLFLINKSLFFFALLKKDAFYTVYYIN